MSRKNLVEGDGKFVSKSFNQLLSIEGMTSFIDQKCTFKPSAVIGFYLFLFPLVFETNIFFND